MRMLVVLIVAEAACTIADRRYVVAVDGAGDDGAMIDARACEEQIAWESNRDGSRDVWVAYPDGNGAINLTNESVAVGNPRYSPTGDKIAFERTEGTTTSLWLIDADGANPRPLTSGFDDSDPQWAPDGSRIAFTRKRDATNSDIWIVGLTGDPVKASLDPSRSDRLPSWSRDSSHLAFAGTAAGDTDTYIASDDGTGALAVLFDTVERARWSPSGTRVLGVVFQSAVINVFGVDPSGLDPDNLTISTTGTDGNPWWSPNGSRVYFSNTNSAVLTFYSMNPDGTAMQPLQSLNSSQDDPAFEMSFDGTRFAWASTRDGNPEIYIGDLAGGQLRITDDPGIDGAPVWRPCP